MSVLGSSNNILIFVQHLSKEHILKYVFDLSDSLEIKSHIKDKGTYEI